MRKTNIRGRRVREPNISHCKQDEAQCQLTTSSSHHHRQHSIKYRNSFTAYFLLNVKMKLFNLDRLSGSLAARRAVKEPESPAGGDQEAPAEPESELQQLTTGSADGSDAGTRIASPPTPYSSPNQDVGQQKDASSVSPDQPELDSPPSTQTVHDDQVETQLPTRPDAQGPVRSQPEGQPETQSSPGPVTGQSRLLRPIQLVEPPPPYSPPVSKIGLFPETSYSRALSELLPSACI